MFVASLVALAFATSPIITEPSVPSARVDHAEVKRLHALGTSDAEIGVAVGCHPGYARLIYTGRVKLRADGGSPHSREEPHTLSGASARLLPFDTPAFMDGRTLFPAQVMAPSGQAILKSGLQSSKIGKRIVKGRWKGFEVYTLTLEERATCPTSCRHWRSCFGNGSHRAIRFQHGPELELALRSEIATLSARHPRGFAIRLHNLGDFYSVEYVTLWRELLATHRELHAFGYSARFDYQRDPIARALIDLVGEKWGRFAIRFSNAPLDQCATISIEHPYQKPDDAIICPQQTGKTQCCATCALCWGTTKKIAFIQH